MPLRKISRYGEQYFPDNLKQWIMSNSLIQIDSFESPSWLPYNTEAQILKDYQGNGVSDYHISVLEVNDSGKENIRIDPEQSFSAVDMYLYGIENIDSAKIVGNFLTEEGNIKTDSATLACKSFNIGHKFPIHLSINENATEVKINCEINNSNTEILSSLKSIIKTTALSRMAHRDFVGRNIPRIGMPVPVQNKITGTPVVIISVDTLRYDVEEQMEPVLSALGENAVVPSEPRTNGHWTPPSHATMFTGVHPGEHKYVGVGEASEHPIHPELITLPQLLNEEKYKCSGIASHARILPEGGFGRGFYRYHSQNMTDWLDRNNDARTAVNRMLRWIEQDRQSDQHSNKLFYFLHIFDPHQPYVPDHPTAVLDNFDLDAIETFGNTKFERQFTGSGGKIELNDEVENTIRSHYTESVKYTARQIRRLIKGLKTHNLFDNALVVVTGDHGEMFGEHGMYKHQSVHYTNIRPFMIVKPPANTDWKVPDTTSTVDLLPTVATAVGAEVPDQCQGTPWQKMSKERSFRITERIRPDTYSVAVEHEGVMGIYTYPERYPERPGQAELEEGPINEEFYRIKDLHADRFDDCVDSLEHDIKKILRTEAEKFISREPILSRDHHRTVQASEETENQLRHLGYK